MNGTEPPGTARAPLADLRVLSVEQFGAGPFGTRALSDLGATIIKVEDPAHGGDVARRVPPFQEGEDSLYFEAFNAGKLSISLDLRTVAGREIFDRLAGEVDAIACNLRGDKAQRLGIDYESQRHQNPGIVCASLSGFGQTGPRACEPAYDYVLQAMAGWMSLTGEPDGPPTKSGLSLVDFSAGYAMALTLLAAVWRARRDGVGGNCDLSLFEVALSMLAYVGTWAASEGYEPPRSGESAHPSIVPFQAFATADGWLTVACAKEKFWEQLCEAMGLAELIADPRFQGFAARHEHREALIPLLKRRFAERSTSEWIAELTIADVPSGPVNGVREALGDRQVIARGGIVGYDHPRLGKVRQPISPLRVSGHEPPSRPAPGRGADTRELLTEWCGYDSSAIERAARRGAFGERPVS